MTPSAARFLDVAGSFGLAARETLAPHIESLGSATSWGLELDASGREIKADFGCAVQVDRAVPHAIATAIPFRLLESLLGPDATDGRWFFEVDCGRGGSTFHAFARLAAAYRAPADLIARARGRVTTETRAMVDGLACLVLPERARFSDVGVVLRDRAEVRLGLIGGANSMGRLLERTASPELRAAFDELVPSAITIDRCVVQLALVPGEPASCTGIEFGVPTGAGWEPLLERLVEAGTMTDRVRAAALSWRGRERLATGGWPLVFAREISHVKLVHRGGRITSRIYLAASSTFGVLV